MRKRLLGLMILVLVATVASSLLAVAVVGQARGQAPAAQGRGGQAAAYAPPKTSFGQPDLQGIWQVMNTADYNVEPHTASFGVPAGLGVIVDPPNGMIPYRPDAQAKKAENFKNRDANDPVGKCWRPGIPRLNYLPFPMQIFQSANFVTFISEYMHNYRTVYMSRTTHLPDVEFWNGDSIGHWEGNTLVVDTAGFNDQTWLDNAGNHHSEALHVVEKYTRTDPDTITYEATLEDPKVYSRPWTMRMLLYRHKEPNFRILEYECHAYAEDAASR